MKIRVMAAILGATAVGGVMSLAWRLVGSLMEASRQGEWIVRHHSLYEPSLVLGLAAGGWVLTVLNGRGRLPDRAVMGGLAGAFAALVLGLASWPFWQAVIGDTPSFLVATLVRPMEWGPIGGVAGALLGLWVARKVGSERTESSPVLSCTAGLQQVPQRMLHRNVLGFVIVAVYFVLTSKSAELPGSIFLLFYVVTGLAALYGTYAGVRIAASGLSGQRGLIVFEGVAVIVFNLVIAGATIIFYTLIGVYSTVD